MVYLSASWAHTVGSHVHWWVINNWGVEKSSNEYILPWDVKSTLALLWEFHHENGHAERLLYRLQSSDAEEEINQMPLLIRGQRSTHTSLSSLLTASMCFCFSSSNASLCSLRDSLCASNLPCSFHSILSFWSKQINSSISHTPFARIEEYLSGSSLQPWSRYKQQSVCAKSLNKRSTWGGCTNHQGHNAIKHSCCGLRIQVRILHNPCYILNIVATNVRTALREHCRP